MIAWLALFGIAVGLGVAYAITPYVQSMLYGVCPRDPASFAGAAPLLGGPIWLSSRPPRRFS